jgi:hypothetical protein
MLKQVLVLAAALVLGALIAAGLLDRPATAQSGEGVGKIHVVAGANAFVMYETAGNQSWVAFPQANDRKFAWFPLKRLDTEQQVGVWRAGKSD